MKYHHNYTRNLKEISASDSRTSFDHDSKFSSESPHEPLQLTRVVTSTLPTPLMAECIFVEDHEQIHQQSALKNNRIPQKPSRMRHETTDKTRHCHWADLPEERDNPNKQNEFSAKADGKGWIHLQQQVRSCLFQFNSVQRQKLSFYFTYVMLLLLKLPGKMLQVFVNK